MCHPAGTSDGYPEEIIRYFVMYHFHPRFIAHYYCILISMFELHCYYNNSDMQIWQGRTNSWKGGFHF